MGGGLFSSGLILGGATLAQAAVAFAANLVLVRYLPPEDFGRFALLQAGGALVMSVLSPRMATLIIRVPRDGMDAARERLLFSALTIEIVVLGAILLGWALLLGYTEPADLGLLAALLLGHWTGHDRAFFERGMRFGRLAGIETATQVAAHLSAVAMVVAGSGATTLYVREMFTAVMTTASLAAIGGLTIRRPRLLSWAEWRWILREARGVWLDSMLENSFQRLTLVLVGGISGLHGAGLFAQANRLALVPHQLLQPLVTRVGGVWFGQEQDACQRRAMRGRMLAWLLPPLVVAAVGTWFLADPVVPFLFGPRWADAAPILSAMAGMVLFLTPFELMRSYAVTTKRVRLLLLARAAQYAGLLVPMGLWLDTVYDANHMAAALSFSYGAAFVTALAVLTRHERKR
ncbi:oligosaccharide flippase family protein [Magnetospirillum aberrantis]|uniref:oligosaccharide flippase family protein n=1 Tax=Magnetospirillum aberrantis TaxID=1105283 RepID=UPI0030B81CE7